VTEEGDEDESSNSNPFVTVSGTLKSCRKVFVVSILKNKANTKIEQKIIKD
jgi:hypothetical protein